MNCLVVITKQTQWFGYLSQYIGYQCFSCTQLKLHKTLNPARNALHYALRHYARRHYTIRHSALRHFALRHHDFFPLNISKTSYPVSTGITTNYTPSQLQRTTVIATPASSGTTGLQRPSTPLTSGPSRTRRSTPSSRTWWRPCAVIPQRSYCTITLRESSLNCRASLPFPGRSYHPSPTIPPHLPSIPSMDHSRARSHCCAPFSSYLATF